MGISPAEVADALAAHDYLADDGLATAIFLALELQRPLLLEGEAGVGKTEVAKVLARWTGGELIRLQCYEGIDVAQAVYEWDYSRQLLHLRTAEATGRAEGAATEALEDELYTERFLVRRALLRAIDHAEGPPPVLLIDEVDRADDEFEAFLLEILSDYQVTVPELGTFSTADPARRDHHLQPDPGRPRRPEASLPLPLGRAPRLRPRGRHRPAAGPAGGREPRPPGRGRRRAAPRAEPLQAARRGRDHRLGPGPGRAGPGRPRRGHGRAPPSARS